jgi:hypothetical protein
MGIFSKLFGKNAAQSESSPMTAEQAVHIIQAYGGVLEKSAPTPGCVADVKKLPFPKAQISEAILIGLRSTSDPKMQEMLKAGFVELSNWQEGVGPDDRGIDTLDLNSSMDIEAQARAILAQSEGMDEWNALVVAEMKLRIAQLKEKGFGTEA